MNWEPHASRVFAIDLRSLALFRVAIACVLLSDLAVRAGDLVAHYTDDGVLPRSALIDSDLLWHPANLSLHLVNGSAVFQAVLFVVAGIAGFFLLVGYRTRLAAIVSWALLVSLQNRNPMILQGGDMLLRCALFWALFLPLGARWSLDAARRRDVGDAPESVFSAASVALLLQVALVYWQAAALKSGNEWIPDGTAVYYTLQIEQFVKPLGVFLRRFPELMKFLTFATWYWEALGPFLLFSPLFFVPLRLFAIAGFIGLHVGLYFSMELGVFPFVSTVVMLPFLPTELWRRISLPSLPRLRTVVERVADELPPAPVPRFHAPLPLQAAVAACFAYVVILNAQGVKRLHVELPDAATVPSQILRIDQVWNMFAPYPIQEDGWFVLPGKLEDGTDVDVYAFREGPVSWERPESVADMYPNDRWRSLLMYLWTEEYADFRLPYARHLCRTWNADRAPGHRLATFEIIFMVKVTPKPGSKPPTPERVNLWEHECLVAAEARRVQAVFGPTPTRESTSKSGSAQARRSVSNVISDGEPARLGGPQ